MDNIFQAIVNANKPSDTVDSWQFGIVADNNDPLNLGRLQVYDQAKGGKYKSSWLFRALPFTAFTPPVPKPGDLVSFGYIDGNPHQGCYSGVIVNNINPAVGSKEDLTIVLGGVKVVMSAKGNVSVTGAKEVLVEATKVTVKASTSLLLEADAITFKGNSSVKFTSPSVDLGSPGTAKLAGKDLVVLGARDSRNDTLVDKGW